MTSQEKRIEKLESANKELLEQLERFGLGIDEFHRNICNKLVKKVKEELEEK